MFSNQLLVSPGNLFLFHVITTIIRAFHHRHTVIQGLEMVCTVLYYPYCVILGLDDVKHQFLPERRQYVFGGAQVHPTTVNQEKSLEESKLGNGVIGDTGSLEAFAAGYTNTYVRRLDHGDVV